MERTPVRQLAIAVLAEACRLLPRVKLTACVERIRLRDLGAVHGRYHPASGLLELNRRMFGGDMTELIDEHGGEHPVRGPAVSQALHTTIHELLHAIGTATGLDERYAWLRLSGWAHAPDDPPGTGRYVERRPGWTPGPSPWRYRAGTFFPRDYSSKSPFEDFADVSCYRALGWTHPFTAMGNGRAKLAYVNRYVWGERSVQSLGFGPGSLHTPFGRRRGVA